MNIDDELRMAVQLVAEAAKQVRSTYEVLLDSGVVVRRRERWMLFRCTVREFDDEGEVWYVYDVQEERLIDVPTYRDPYELLEELVGG